MLCKISWENMRYTNLLTSNSEPTTDQIMSASKPKMVDYNEVTWAVGFVIKIEYQLTVICI